MDTRTIDLVQASWTIVMPIKVVAGKLFCSNWGNDMKLTVYNQRITQLLVPPC
jgi:hypothetical protein